MSFDQYFGTLSGVAGFADPDVPRQPDRGGLPVFDQFGWRPGHGRDPAGYLQPFRLVSDPPLRDGQCTNDISHSWATQHRSWHGGALDAFLTAHLAADKADNAPLAWGEHLVREVLTTLTANPDVWARTVLFLVHDENGGFFDHVPPPVAPDGTEGEWLTGPLQQPPRPPVRA